MIDFEKQPLCRYCSHIRATGECREKMNYRADGDCKRIADIREKSRLDHQEEMNRIDWEDEE